MFLWSIGRVPRRSKTGGVREELERGWLTYGEVQVVFLVDFLHETVHFCALGIGMLPELSWDFEGIHLSHWRVGCMAEKERLD